MPSVNVSHWPHADTARTRILHSSTATLFEIDAAGRLLRHLDLVLQVREVIVELLDLVGQVAIHVQRVDRRAVHGLNVQLVLEEGGERHEGANDGAGERGDQHEQVGQTRDLGLAVFVEMRGKRLW